MTWREVPRVAWAFACAGVALGVLGGMFAALGAQTIERPMAALFVACCFGAAALVFIAGVSRETPRTNRLTPSGESG